MTTTRIDNSSTPVVLVIDDAAATRRGGGYDIDLRSLTSPDVIVVRDVDDLDGLPRSGGGIVLEAGRIYHFLGTAALRFPLIIKGPVGIRGGGAEATFITANFAEPLLRLSGPLAAVDLRDVTLANSAGPCITVDPLTPSAFSERTINASGVNFQGTGDVIKFQDSAFAVFFNCAWRECDGVGVAVDGEILGLVVDNCAFRLNADGFIAIIKPSTCTVFSRIRVSQSTISSPASGYGLSIDPTGISDESLVVTNVNFNGSGDAIDPGTVGPDSVKAHFKTNLGVESTYPRAAYVVTTPIAVSASLNVPIKLTGTTADIESQLFDFPTSNRARYVGSKPRRFQARASATFISTKNSQLLRLNFAVDGIVATAYKVRGETDKGGGIRLDSLTLDAILELEPQSYVELWVTNETSNDDIEWTDGSVILTEIGG